MIVMFGTPKGGTGKTTLLTNLAAMLVSKGRSVAILKAEKNEELQVWHERRREAGLAMMPLHEAYGDIQGDMSRLQKLADIVLVDTAGHDSREFRSGLMRADVLLSPLRPSSQVEIDNLPRLTQIVRAVQGKENPALRAYVLFNRCKTSSHKDAIDLAAALNNDPDWLPSLRTCISFLDVFETSVNLGGGVHDVERASSLGKARGQIELLAKEIGLI